MTSKYRIVARSNGWIADRNPGIFKTKKRIHSDSDIAVVIDDYYGCGYPDKGAAIHQLEASVVAQAELVCVIEPPQGEQDWFDGEGYYDCEGGKLRYSIGGDRFEEDGVIYWVQEYDPEEDE